MAFSIFVFIQWKEAAKDRAGVRISEMHLAQIPGSHPHMDLLEVTVAGGHLEPNPSQADRAIRAALGAFDFRGEGQFQFCALRTWATHIAVVEITFERSGSQFGMLGPVIFH